MDEDLIDAFAYSIQAKDAQIWKRVHCEGVGDNNGYFELQIKK